MTGKPDEVEHIVDLLTTKSSLKQTVYRKTFALFKELKQEISALSLQLEDEMAKRDPNVSIRFNERGDFDAEFKFSGDMLVFSMHSNVFCFNAGHPIMNTDYIRADKNRSYCGLINIYNFLADSYKYTRMNDVGILVARVFINHESHFFVEGRQALGHHFTMFDKLVFDAENQREVLHIAMTDALMTDLTPPTFENVELITLQQKLSEIGNAGLRTGKRLGFEVKGSLTSDYPSDL